jgi:hypothetical protein
VKKVVSSGDDESELEAVSPPKPRGARAAVAKKPAYVADIDSDEEEAAQSDDESDFNEDSD